MYSRYLQSLAALALSLRLDKILRTSLDPLNLNNQNWQWLANLGLTIRTAESLIFRTKLPTDFVERFKIGTTEKAYAHIRLSIYW